MTEHWGPILGYEGLYEVSDMGQAHSLDRVVAHARNGSRRVRGQILRQRSSEDDPRLRVILFRDGKGTSRLVSQLVAETFLGARPPGKVACHNNGNCTDNRSTNLRWDTPSGNQLDRRRHGTHEKTRRTHCPLSHALAEPNLIPWALQQDGSRQCLACNRGRSEVRRVRARGEIIDLRTAADRHYVTIMR